VVALPDRGLGTALSSILDQWSTDDEGSARRAGLTALIPGDGAGLASAASTGGGGFRDMVTASLEVLRSLVAVDLSAFVYRVDGEGYRVIGRQPPAGFDAFELLAVARTQIEAGRGFGEHLVGDLCCVGVASGGRRSRGLVLLGRIGDRLTTEELRAVAPLSQVLGALLQTATGLA
jgi:hypothetical protein